LETFNPNQIAQGAMMGINEKRRRQQAAASFTQAILENQIPLELIGTPEGEAMVKNLRIENEPGIQEILGQARRAATVPKVPAEQRETTGGAAYTFPEVPERRMNIPEAQQAGIKREFGIKMAQKEYENAMELKKYDTQKQIELFYKQLGEKTPQQTAAWIRETMDAAKAAGLDVEGITYEGVTAAGPHREEGRGLEKQRLSDEQFRSYQTAVKDAMNFKFAGAKYLADLRTGKQGLMGNLINLFSAGSDVDAVAQGQYIKDPQKRYQFMLSMINRGIDDWNKVVSDTEKQYRLRPTKPFEPVNDKLLNELANVEAKTGKSFAEFVDGLGVGKLFDKAKAAVAQIPNGLDQSGAAQKAAEYAAFRAKYPNEPESLVKMAWQKYLASIGR
jgi:hypothetical protein